MKLYNLFEEVILEAVTRDKVIKAIDGKYRVNILYQGEDENFAFKRTIDVYALGLSTAGNLIIRAYQPFGATTTEIPKWKFFRLDRIEKWEPTNYKFYKPISDYDPSIPTFNRAGDNAMSTVYNIAKF